MKKIILFLFLFLVFPVSVFAQTQTMSVSESYECSYIVNSSYTSAGAVPSYQTPWADLHIGEGAITSSGGVKTLTLTKTNEPTGTIYYTPISVAWYAWTGTEWLAISSTSVAKTWSLSALHVDYWGVANLPAEGCPVTDPCVDSYPAKIAECGGDAKYVLNWDAVECTGTCDTCEKAHDDLITKCGDSGVANWDPVNCYGACRCDMDAPTGFNNKDTYCADYGGYSYYDYATCQPVCENCATVEIECPYGLASYDPATCEYTCDTCLTRRSKCPWECKFTCNTPGNVTIVSDCQCEADPNPVDEPPVEVPPDETDDPTAPPNTPPDPTDNPPDPTDPPDDSPAPDGNNDNAILDKIERNTLATQKEVDRLADLTQTELNKANASLTNIHSDIESTNTILKTELNKEVANTKNIDAKLKQSNKYLKKIAANTYETQKDTGYIKQFMETLVGWFTEPDFNPTDLVATAENQIGTAWDEQEATTQTDILASINGLTGVGEEEIGFFESLYTSFIPTNSSCSDIDLSFSGHSLFIDCSVSVLIKEFLYYLCSILTVLTIFGLIFNEMKPKS